VPSAAHEHGRPTEVSVGQAQRGHRVVDRSDRNGVSAGVQRAGHSGLPSGLDGQQCCHRAQDSADPIRGREERRRAVGAGETHLQCLAPGRQSGTLALGGAFLLA
jgi:hypothetical protein